MFPCSDWATTHILENIPHSLGDIERVKTQYIIVRNGIMERMLLSERPHILSRGNITQFTPYGQNYNIYSLGTALSHKLP